MIYIKMTWEHEIRDIPIIIYAELNGDFWDQRKVEIFKNGKIGYAERDDEFGGTILGKERWPDLEGLNEEPDTTVTYISKSDFESQWDKRK